MPETPEGRVYWAGPLRPRDANLVITGYLLASGLDVRTPNLLDLDLDDPSDVAAARAICKKAIVESNVLAFNAGQLGADSAWEIGFASGLGDIQIVGTWADPVLGQLDGDLDRPTSAPRLVKRKTHAESEMHGWDTNPPLGDTPGDADVMRKLCAGKSVVICVPDSNEETLRELVEMDLGAVARSVRILRRPDLPPPAFAENVDFLHLESSALISPDHLREVRDADLMIVGGRRYGLDTSFLMGLRAATEAPVVGWLGHDDGLATKLQTISDQWTHPPGSHFFLPGMTELSAALYRLNNERHLPPLQAHRPIPADPHDLRFDALADSTQQTPGARLAGDHLTGADPRASIDEAGDALDAAVSDGERFGVTTERWPEITVDDETPTFSDVPPFHQPGAPGLDDAVTTNPVTDFGNEGRHRSAKPGEFGSPMSGLP